jgi:hypothetical protein
MYRPPSLCSQFGFLRINEALINEYGLLFFSMLMPTIAFKEFISELEIEMISSSESELS